LIGNLKGKTLLKNEPTVTVLLKLWSRWFY